MCRYSMRNLLENKKVWNFWFARNTNTYRVDRKSLDFCLELDDWTLVQHPVVALTNWRNQQLRSISQTSSKTMGHFYLYMVYNNECIFMILNSFKIDTWNEPSCRWSTCQTGPSTPGTPTTSTLSTKRKRTKIISFEIKNWRLVSARLLCNFVPCRI